MKPAFLGAIGLVLSATLTLSGCATQMSANTYQDAQTQQAMRIKLATVVDVRTVAIEAKPSGVGSTAGATVGALIHARQGRGGLLEGFATTVAGGLLGYALEKSTSTRSGLEITYEVVGTREVEAIVQEQDNQGLQPGDKIKIISGATASRVVKL